MIKNIFYLLGRRSFFGGLLILLGSLILIFLELVSLGSIPLFLGFYIDPNNLLAKFPLLERFLNINFFDISNESIFLGIILFSIFLIKNLYSLLYIFFNELYFAELKRKISSDLLKKYLNLDINFFKENNSSLLNRNIIFESRVAVSYINFFIKFIKDLLLSFTILIVLIIINPIPTIIIVIFFSIFIIFYYFIIKNVLLKNSKGLTDIRGLHFKNLSQIFNSIKLINLRQNQEFFYDKFNKFNETEKKLTLISGFIPKVPRYIFEIIAVFALIFVLIFLTEFQNKTIVENLPILTFYVLSFIRVVPLFNSISECLSYLRSTSYQFNYIVNQSKISSSLDKKEISHFQSNHDDDNKILNFQNLEVKDLFFNYSSKKFIFENVNLKIQKNKNICIMGKTGSGKSTFMDVIMGFQKPKKGQILINKINLENVLPSWKKKIGYIPQDIYLNDTTIAENIAFGVDKDKIDLKQLNRVIELAQLKIFVDSLQNKAFSMVGEKGSKLSGGQIQRIGIARALYFKPEILILDEATNALDEETERNIMQEIDKLKKTYTIITITHKKEVAEFCDEIYLIEGLKIVKKN
jgi:ATP-binding cassette, subfamily B, bacterial PglK